MRVASNLGHRLVVGLAALAAVLAATAGATAADSPPANATRTVDARDADPCLTPAAYDTTYGHPPTPTQQLATCTDLTYAAPPAHAARMTTAAFPALEPGGADTSVHPPHADRESEGAIADAHATVFAVHPATRVHLDSTTTRQYIAPTGTVRALVDYRVRDNLGPNRSVRSHTVRTVTLDIGTEQVASTTGAQTPTLSYDTTQTGEQSLTVTAEIAVMIAVDGPRTTTFTQTVTVSDTRSVWVYQLTPEAYTARYPDGRFGLAVYQGNPWHSLTLSEDGTHRVRGVWRYYTARDPRWDRLTVARATATTTRPAAATPLRVAAFPAQIGPRAVPVRDGPTLTAVWGVTTRSPAARLPPNVSVGVISDEYTRSYGVAVRNETLDPERIQVHGVVRGVSAPLSGVTRTARPIREPNLSVRLTDSSGSAATLRITVRDSQTGAPLRVTESAAPRPIVADRPDGTLSINGEPVMLGPDGTATRTVAEPGLYTVRFEPAPWRTTSPAYTAASDTVRWHPLGTLAVWVQLLETTIWIGIPVAVAWIAGRQVAHLMSGESRL
jgi:hypothetical protein